MALTQGIGTQLNKMTDAVSGWHILSFDAGNQATNLASILYTVSKGQKPAAKVKATYHHDMVMLFSIKLLLAVLKIRDPKTRLKDAINK